MQIIHTRPLIEKFQNKAFEDSEVGPYFLAYMLMTSVVLLIPSGEFTFWFFATGVSCVIITLFGVLHLKRQNGDSFGDQFLAKYFSLGWVVTVRLLLLSIPAVVVMLAGLSIIGAGEHASDAAGTLFTISWAAAFYYWLGLLIRQTTETTQPKHLGHE